MTNQQYMAIASFEREKNLKASGITALVCVLLFLLFFFLQWTLPQVTQPEFGEGIEVNLGNSETGLGDIAPQIPGEPSALEDVKAAPQQAAETPAQPSVEADEHADEDAPVVNKTTKPLNKPVIKENPPVKKPVKATVTNVTPAPPKAKAVFKGGTTAAPGGNRADSYNGVRDQGIAGGKGDQGNPNGNPNSDSYKGNAASGNGGSGGAGGGGVSIRNGLDGRRFSRLPSFEDDFNENAKVAVDITVDKAGNVLQAIVNNKGTTTTNQNIRNIALRKARSLKLTAGNEEQSGTLVFSFKVRG